MIRSIGYRVAVGRRLVHAVCRGTLLAHLPATIQVGRRCPDRPRSPGAALAPSPGPEGGSCGMAAVAGQPLPGRRNGGESAGIRIPPVPKLRAATAHGRATASRAVAVASPCCWTALRDRARQPPCGSAHAVGVQRVAVGVGSPVNLDAGSFGLFEEARMRCGARVGRWSRGRRGRACRDGRGSPSRRVRPGSDGHGAIDTSLRHLGGNNDRHALDAALPADWFLGDS